MKLELLLLISPVSINRPNHLKTYNTLLFIFYINFIWNFFLTCLFWTSRAVQTNDIPTISRNSLKTDSRVGIEILDSKSCTHFSPHGHFIRQTQRNVCIVAFRPIYYAVVLSNRDGNAAALLDIYTRNAWQWTRPSTSWHIRMPTRNARPAESSRRFIRECVIEPADKRGLDNVEQE